MAEEKLSLALEVDGSVLQSLIAEFSAAIGALEKRVAVLEHMLDPDEDEDEN